jgi:hypothetical protein
LPVERSQYATRVGDQIKQAVVSTPGARSARPLLWILSLGKRCGRRELVPEVDRQPVGQGRAELAAQDCARRRRPHEADQTAGCRDGGVTRVLESHDGIPDAAFVPSAGERDCDPLNADEVAGVDEPAFPHHDGRLQMDAVQVELAAVVDTPGPSGHRTDQVKPDMYRSDLIGMNQQVPRQA